MAIYQVIDRNGQALSPCAEEKAQKLLVQGKAQLVSADPLTIQLDYAVDLPPEPEPAPPVGTDKRILLHICCAPCATYPIERLRELAFSVSGYWYNPNIHPFAEHQMRRASLEAYAVQVKLPMLWHEAYEMPAFLQRVVGKERFRQRCALCYAMRLEQTAHVASEQSYDAFTTTLLISPYQDQAMIRQIGERMGQRYGVSFFFENLRQGWHVRGKLARACDLYQQQYCGCIYSEWEAQCRTAWTAKPPAGGDE